MGRPPLGDRAMTAAERQRRRREFLRLRGAIRAAEEKRRRGLDAVVQGRIGIVTAMAEAAQRCQSDDELRQFVEEHGLPVDLYDRQAWIEMASCHETLRALTEREFALMLAGSCDPQRPAAE